MARNKKTDALIAQAAEAMDAGAIEAALAEAEAQEVIAAETPAPVDMAQALAEVNGASQMAADEAQAQAEDEAEDEAKSFAELLDAVTETQASDKTRLVLAGFADRAQYELDMDPTNTNIQKTLSKLQKAMTPGVAKAMVVAEVGADYMNRSEVTGKRRNVYALEKLRDILYGAVTGHPQNAINKAVLVSLFRLRELKLPFTGAVAKACASDKVAIDPVYKPHLRRHTVSEATASTQASSTMTALEDLGIVKNTGSRQHPIYEVVTSPLAQQLEQVVRKNLMPVAA